MQRARRRGLRWPVVLTVLLVLGACQSGGGDRTQTGEELGERAGEEPDGGDTTTSTTTASSTTAATPVTRPLAVTDTVVPDAAPDGVDACGAAIDYGAANLTDSTADTAWRMPGDATGLALTFHLDGPRRVRSLGVLPGYAKVDPCDGVDRWPENRRPVTVTWIFDDGSSVSQPLGDEPTTQWAAADVTTSTVTLRIDGVTADPVRDFTAISEVAIEGD